MTQSILVLFKAVWERCCSKSLAMGGLTGIASDWPGSQTRRSRLWTINRIYGYAFSIRPAADYKLGCFWQQASSFWVGFRKFTDSCWWAVCCHRSAWSVQGRNPNPRPHTPIRSYWSYHWLIWASFHRFHRVAFPPFWGVPADPSPSCKLWRHTYKHHAWDFPTRWTVPLMSYSAPRSGACGC